MDNIIITDGKEYKFEKVWRQSKSDYSRDSNEKLFPYPKSNQLVWPGKSQFIERLSFVGKILDGQDNMYKNYKVPRDCLLCNANAVSTRSVGRKTNWLRWRGICHQSLGKF